MEQWYRAAGAIDNSAITDRECHGTDDARLWRHAHGHESGNQRGERLGLLARSAESRHSRSLGHGNQRSEKSDAHASGHRVAYGRVSGEKLEERRYLVSSCQIQRRELRIRNWELKWHSKLNAQFLNPNSRLCLFPPISVAGLQDSAWMSDPDRWAGRFDRRSRFFPPSDYRSADRKSQCWWSSRRHQPREE